jgi:hypothetical protein
VATVNAPPSKAELAARKEAAEHQVLLGEERLRVLRQELLDVEMHIREPNENVNSGVMQLPPKTGAKFIDNASIVLYHSDGSSESIGLEDSG